MNRRGRGGFVSSITGGIITLVLIGVILAALEASGVTSIEKAVKTAKDKALEYSECIPSGDCGIAAVVEDVKDSFDGSPSNLGNSGEEGNGTSIGDIDLPDIDFNEVLDKETEGYRGPAEGEPFVNEAGFVSKDTAHSMLQELETVNDKEDSNKDVGYSRSEWKHWLSLEGKPCWSVRNEVLNRDAVPGTVKYLDRKKNATDNYDEACAIGTPVEEKGRIKVSTENSGKWIDPYSGDEITSSSSIDIDHVIPLSNAARNGGQKWDKDKKELFANDLDNLLATSASENRSKGDKGPGEYMPPNKSYHCQYAKTYTSVAYKYSLTITDSDYKVLNKAVNNCEY